MTHSFPHTKLDLPSTSKSLPSADSATHDDQENQSVLGHTVKIGKLRDYWRDVSTYKRQQKIHEARCNDWVLVGGECHYAKDRTSFKEYRSINGTEGIIGVGTVELEVFVR
ncbi:hypothetical protein BJ875DRAFT_494798 [Amylocarpus encephaloides]|uniref:Uncharacterized protein n=1 Tax=Amylocarpus encephaloides TaxID=45428 RepID=A0A9P7YLG8_9HELO|nr:hypothetical protein BJ875DRAFT_494798 [Amylocarpus encephaloides]